MKKCLILFLFMNLMMSCTHCEELKIPETISKVKVHYLPFGILSPVGGPTESEILNMDSIIITDKNKINTLKSHIEELKKQEKDVVFGKNSIYLRVDLYTEKDTNLMTILFDKSTFKIDDCYYKENQKLTNLLIEGFKSTP